MIKKDLILKISNETGITQNIVKDIIQKTFDSIVESLSRKEKVELRNFGVFELKRRNPRIGRNPNQPQNPIKIPAKVIPSFKPSVEMYRALDRNAR